MVRALIVAEVRLYREGLHELLDRADGLKVVGTASSYRDAVALLQQSPLDVILLDMSMPHGVSAIKEIKQVARNVTVVAFALREVEKDVLACIEAGASGWVSPDASLEVLVDAVLKAVRGELVCSTRIAGSLVRQVRRLSSASGAAAAPVELTPRQVEIATLINRGQSNKEIARELCIGLSTVKVHVHNILEKMHVSRRGEAAAKLRPYLTARREGLDRTI